MSTLFRRVGSYSRSIGSSQSHASPRATLSRPSRAAIRHGGWGDLFCVREFSCSLLHTAATGSVVRFALRRLNRIVNPRRPCHDEARNRYRRNASSLRLTWWYYNAFHSIRRNPVNIFGAG